MYRTLLPLVIAAYCSTAAATPANPRQQALYDIFKEMIEVPTQHPTGDNTRVAQLAAARLKAGGYAASDMEVVVPAEKKGNLVARLKGTGERRPMLLLAHIDVVDARKEDWSDGIDPFKLTEKDGHYYGRGTLDDKAMAAIFVDVMLRLKAEGFKAPRDIILALTADEEGGTHNGVAWLLKNRRELIDAEFALNEGGVGQLRDGKPMLHAVQVSEKMFLTFDFEAANPGGHSSVPRRDNAIYDLAQALERLARHDFPVRLNYVSRTMLFRLAKVETPAVAAAMEAVARDEATAPQEQLVSLTPVYNSLLRTTCVATRLEAGHADNALPQRARATVNCRLLPREDPQLVHQQLQKLAGERVSVKPRHEARASEPTDAESARFRRIAAVSESLWPGTPVTPTMSAGATDGSMLRNAGIPTYGTSGIFVPFGEVRIHGKDERIPVKSLYEAQEYLYRLVKALAVE
jgi:acetylornithine deacetylase/succinyl-diaminopimelate desuccinylase-like protein